MRNKILSLLVLLLTAASGAWAQATCGAKEITPDMVPDSWNGDNSAVTADDLAKWGFVEITEAEAKTWTGAPQQGTVRLIYTISSGSKSLDWKGGVQNGGATDYTHNNIYQLVCNPTYSSDFDVFITTEPPFEVIPVAEPAANTQQWTFTMPGSDVLLTPVYAPTAAWALDNEKPQLPTAAEGVIAGTADALIAEGTVAVTTIGVGTEAQTVAQGTVMYAVTTTDAKPAPTAFSATVPTGAVLTGSYTENQTVYVWYYIKGIDAAEGVTPTAENTFNDSEICTTPLTITLKANQFDLNITPAPVSNATVTVAGTAATAEQLNTGKIEKVGTGSEIKLKAAAGYKFKNVVVKEKDGDNTVTVTINDAKTEATFTMPTYDVTAEYEVEFYGYTITVGAGEYATFYKDEALYTEDENAELYTIASVTDTEAVLSDQIKVAPAKTPLLIYNKGEKDMTFILLPTEEQADAITAADQFKGTLAAKDMPASKEGEDYYVCTGKEFVWVRDAGAIAANKCWIEIIAQAASARANTRSITGGGDTTGIDAATRDDIDGDYYDLQGRKVLKPNSKGIYIHNGKKVIKH